MLAKCIFAPNKSFQCGVLYEIARIDEFPGHIMVQKANGTWPMPGDELFGWHPEELFGLCPEAIESKPCGYVFHKIEFYGYAAVSCLNAAERGIDVPFDNVSRNLIAQRWADVIYNNSLCTVTIIGFAFESVCEIGSFSKINQLLNCISDSAEVTIAYHCIEIWAKPGSVSYMGVENESGV